MHTSKPLSRHVLSAPRLGISAIHLAVLLLQLGFGLAVVAGGAWALWVVVAAPLIAAVMPS